MLTYPKSTMSVRHIPMHLTSGHVNLMPGKFYLPPNFPQSDLGRRVDSRWALPQISSYFSFSTPLWFSVKRLHRTNRTDRRSKYSSLKDWTPLKATEHHLPYGITQCYLPQKNAPHLNCSQIRRYSIYLPRRDGRLSWPRRLVTYRDGLPARRQSPITVLTEPGVQ